MLSLNFSGNFNQASFNAALCKTSASKAFTSADILSSAQARSDQFQLQFSAQMTRQQLIDQNRKYLQQAVQYREDAKKLTGLAREKCLKAAKEYDELAKATLRQLKQLPKK
ncbi:MAG: hypothetical protein VKJ04_07835 [Vampirovibrionales bacterium]|nr:hypothetical protein [Vampirovibrionales bacterium]